MTTDEFKTVYLGN